MKPGEKFDFVLRSTDGYVVIAKKNISLEQGLQLFVKEVRVKYGLNCKLVRCEDYFFGGDVIGRY